MSRKLFVYTKLDMVNKVFYEHMLNSTWYETTKEISEGTGDVYTTQMYALSGAQEIFDEIYIDDNIIWPNEKQNITKKELRRGHNLCKLFAPWFRYLKDGESI